MRLFLLYLATMIIVTIVRSLILLRYCYFRGGASETVRDGFGDPDRLAAKALASRIPHQTSVISGKSGGNSQDTLRNLRSAEISFRYLWNNCNAQVQGISRLVPVTLLLSVLITTYGFVPTLFDYGVSGARDSLYETILTLLRRFTLGIFASVVLFLISEWFKAALMRRNTNWQYFVSKVKHELSDEQ